MKEYKVTITETLKKTVFVEAESQDEAEQIAADKWAEGEYILDADNFTEVDYEAEDVAPKQEMSYAELTAFFRSVNDKHLDPIVGYVVFTTDSFDKPYNAESRTYAISSNNKAYQSGMGGFSIYASCLDGTDPCLRLDGYMRGENAWKIEKCYLLQEDYDRLTKQFELEKDRPPRQVER